MGLLLSYFIYFVRANERTVIIRLPELFPVA